MKSNVKTYKVTIIILLPIFLMTLICATIFTGCTGRKSVEGQAGTENKISVTASFYVVYDFAGKIGGDKVTVKNLLPAGSDPHGWEPSPKDIISIEKADVFVYNGAGMEGWVDKVLESISNKNLIIVEAAKDIELRKANHEHESEHGHDEKDGEKQADQEKKHIYDPHVWLDPAMAKIQMRAIADALVKVDPDNKDYYEKNFEKYSRELEKLDSEFREAASGFKKKDIVVSHEAFGYLAAAYGLNQVAISGLDAEAEPTAARMVDVANFTKDNNVSVIFFDKLVNPKVANAIAQSAGAKVEVLNPIASLSEKELKEGKDYFSAMRENLEALKRALK
ncbi:MAG TPA: metal ABC transporter substrate-binding protein [Clostridiales bacterium]|nr:metal ABC transporter substrate-binding protein [Clostridiales bacterium]